VVVVSEADLLEIVGRDIVGSSGTAAQDQQGGQGDEYRNALLHGDLLGKFRVAAALQQLHSCTAASSCQWCATASATVCFFWPLRIYCSNSGRNFLTAFLTGQPAPSDRPQMVVPGMMPIRWPTSARISRSSRRPCPARIRSRICNIQPVPSRHGVHCPHDSCEKKRAIL